MVKISLLVKAAALLAAQESESPVCSVFNWVLSIPPLLILAAIFQLAKPVVQPDSGIPPKSMQKMRAFIFGIAGFLGTLVSVLLAETLDDFSPLLPPLERQVSRKFEEAKTLVAQERFVEAVPLLGALLESELRIIAVEPAVGETTRETWHQRVEQMLISLPEAAQTLYHQQYDALAESLQESLKRDENASSLSEISLRRAAISNKYLLTPAGREATVGLSFIAGYACGAAVPAIARLQRLQSVQTPNLSAPAKELTALFPYYYLMLGKRDAALSLLRNEAFMAEVFAGKIFDGRLQHPHIHDVKCTPEEWCDAILSVFAENNPLTFDAVQSTPPILDFDWRVPRFTHPQWAREAQRVEQEATRPFLSLKPLVTWSGILIMRGMDETFALDIDTGIRIWRVSESDPYTVHNRMNPLFDELRISRQDIFLRDAPRVMKTLLANYPLYHSLSGDGNLFFQIESLPFAVKAVVPGGTSEYGNTLVARDIRNGEIIWQWGKRCAAMSENNESNNAETRLLNEQTFLGTPVFSPFGELFVLGESGGIIRLWGMETKTGRVTRVQPVAMPRTPITHDLQRARAATSPADCNGVLICPTGAGLVTAIDTLSGMPLWTHCYRREPLESRRVGRLLVGGESFNSFNARHQAFCMHTHNRVIFVPSDVAMILALDLETGEVLWRQDDLIPEAFLGVAAMDENSIYCLTQNTIVAIDLATGKWRTNPAAIVSSLLPDDAQLPSFPELPRAAGFGVHVNNGTLWLPLADQTIAVIDLANHAVQTRWKSPVPLGNLVAAQNKVFSSAAQEIVCFPQQSSQTEHQKYQKSTRAIRRAQSEGNAHETVALLQAKLEKNHGYLSRREEVLFANVLQSGLKENFAMYAANAVKFATRKHSFACDFIDLANDRAARIRILLMILDSAAAQQSPELIEIYNRAANEISRLCEEEDSLITFDKNLHTRLSRVLQSRCTHDEKLFPSQKFAQVGKEIKFDWLDYPATWHHETLPFEPLFGGRFLVPHITSGEKDVSALNGISLALEKNFAGASLIATYAWGEELWRVSLPVESLELENFTSERSLWATSLGRLLLVICGQELVALTIGEADDNETDGNEKSPPRILWQKRLDEPLLANIVRKTLPLETAEPDGICGTRVVITPQAICFADSNGITALDPATGEKVWQRECDTRQTVLTGNCEHLFLISSFISPRASKISAIDARSGRVIAEGKMPSGDLIGVVREFLVLRDTGDALRWRIDLLDCEKWLAQTRQKTCDPVVQTLRNNFTTGTLLRIFPDENLLALLMTSGSLRLYDVRSGQEVMESPKLSRARTSDFNVEILRNDKTNEDEILVTQFHQEPLDLQSPTPPRNRTWLRAMRYQRDGTPCWEQEVTLPIFHSFANLPHDFPLLLMSAPRDSQNQPAAKKNDDERTEHFVGIDKRTGKECFRKCFSIVCDESYAGSRSVYKTLHAAADPTTQTIRFTISPREIRVVKFAQEE